MDRKSQEALTREIEKAMNRFPRIVAEKARRYKERQKFLKRTFGDLVKQLRSDLARFELTRSQ